MNPNHEVFRNDVADWVLNLPVAAAFGFTFCELSGGRATTRLDWRPELSHVPGAFQASPIATLADFTGAAAGMTLLPPGSAAATVDYTAKFLCEARGHQLLAKARVLRPGRALTVAAVDVYAVADAAETLCATSLVTIRNIPAAMSPS
jgi:uncharacterized protein (TIGR00369 family)